MKTLIIVRHAKSGWDDPSLRDHDRPLNDRGLRDAPRMAAHCATTLKRPDHMCVSTAVRARTTAAFFREAWNIADGDVEERADLYLASRKGLADAVAEFDDRWDRVMIVGHNPGLTDLVEYYAGGPDRHLPTCSVVVLRFAHATSWAETGRGTGTVEMFLYPKALWER